MGASHMPRHISDSQMQFDDHRYLDSVKGVLIILVVLGHCIYVAEYGTVKTFVYSFHVYAFFLIPFILPAKTATWGNLVDAATRYFMPYLAVVFLASIPYGCMQGYSIQEWLWLLVRGVMTGNANYLKATSGLYLFWFLPVIFWVNILLQVYNRIGVVEKGAFVTLAVIAHVLLPAMSWDHKQSYPFLGTHIAMYVMPVGILFRYLCRRMDVALCARARFVWLIGFVLLIATMFVQGSSLNLGHLGCPSYRSPFKIVMHDLIPVFALLMLIGFSELLFNIRFLVSAGRSSLHIYLFSQPAVIGVTLLYRRWLGLNGQVDILLCSILSVVSGVVFGLVVARGIEKLPTVRMLLFPRSFNELFIMIHGCIRTFFRIPSADR